MHILILESGLTGHHANYLEHIAATFLQQGHRLTVSVRVEHSDNPLFASLKAAHPGRLTVKVTPPLKGWALAIGCLGILGSELSHWLMFNRFYESLTVKDEVDHVFIPYLDYCLHATALFGAPWGNITWSGICMRPSFHYANARLIAPKPKWRAIKEQLFYRLLQQPSLNKLLTIDELLEQQTRQKRPLNAHKLTFVPDPAELTNDLDRTTARRRLGIPEKDFVILVYGAIDVRKGIDDLLSGVRNKPFPKNVKILVMGRHTPALRDRLHSETQVISIDAYVDNATEEAGFRAADAVWIGYSAHYGMSGVLILAAMAAKPVLATRNGLIGWMTKQHSLGTVIDCSNSSEVTHAIQHLIATSPSALPSAGMQAVQLRHTWTEFNRTLLQALPSQKNF